MTDAMPNVTKALKLMDSDPRSHMFAAAIPQVLAAGLKAWHSSTPYQLDYRIEFVMDAMAESLLKVADSPPTE